MESSLSRLAELVRARNTVENNMANLIEREVHLNSVGDHIAANVFGIRLVPTTIQSGFVGIFITPALSGKTVDIRWYPRRESYINIHTDPAPDYSLILAGPRVEPSEARGLANPWLLTSVYLFSMQDLLASLRARGVRIGPRVSINSQLWEQAELFPVQRNLTLMLTDSQRQLLKLFA